MSGKLQVICGGQFGSEAKGAVAAALGHEEGFQLGAGVRVAGPNAGHTVVDHRGREWKLQQVPVTAVTNPTAMLLIAAGSEIEPSLLAKEVSELDDAGYMVSDRMVVDPQATVINPSHQTMEMGGADHTHGTGGITRSIGSTGKGVGAARAQRIWRDPGMTVGEAYEDFNSRIRIGDTSTVIRNELRVNHSVQIEGTQGYGLGLHAGYYPYCTSSDCRAIDFLAMAGISPWDPAVSEVEPWVVFRTYPIRVAGNSGPLHGEITWPELSGKLGTDVEEYTTVTKKPRRIGEWDPSLARRAIAANGGSNARVCVSFLDYWEPKLAGSGGPELLGRLDHPSYRRLRNSLVDIQDQIGARISMVGTGPRINHYTRIPEGIL